MDEQGEEWECEYASELGGTTPSTEGFNNWEAKGSKVYSCGTAEVWKGTSSSGAGEVDNVEGLRVGSSLEEPTGSLEWKGDVAVHEAAQPTDVATHKVVSPVDMDIHKAATVAESEEDKGFDPDSFWRLLEQAGHETW